MNWYWEVTSGVSLENLTQFQIGLSRRSPTSLALPVQVVRIESKNLGYFGVEYAPNGEVRLEYPKTSNWPLCIACMQRASVRAVFPNKGVVRTKVFSR